MKHRSYDSGWDAKWFEDRFRGREGTFQLIAGMCEETGCKSVLDVGGGTGLMRNFLPSTIEYDVVDISRNAVSWGRKLFPNVKFTTGNIDDITMKYDAIIAVSVIEHMKYYDSFLRTAWDKMNKIIVMSFRNGLNGGEEIRFQGGGNSYYDNKYSIDSMKLWINSELKPERIEFFKVDVDRKYSPEIVLLLGKG